jgi:hypothetical protein
MAPIRRVLIQTVIAICAGLTIGLVANALPPPWGAAMLIGLAVVVTAAAIRAMIQARRAAREAHLLHMQIVALMELANEEDDDGPSTSA